MHEDYNMWGISHVPVSGGVSIKILLYTQNRLAGNNRYWSSVNQCVHRETLQWKVKSAMKKITAVLGAEFTVVTIICAILLRVRSKN